MSELPVVFLGVTHPHAEGRARRLARVEGARAVACFDADPAAAAAFADAHGMSAVSFEAALERAQGGLAILETRNVLVADYAVRAAEAGVAVLLEKPGAQDLATLRDVRDRIQATGVFAQVGYHMRYAPSVAPALEHVRAGRLGTITTGRFHASVQAPWLTNEWFTDTEDRGGLIFLDACHVVDLLVLLLGDASRVTARTRKLPALAEHPFEDSAAMILEFGDTLVAGDVCGWESNDWVDTWNVELYGTTGTLILGIHPPRLRIWTPRDGATGGWITRQDEVFDGELNYEFELRDVVTRLRNGQAPGGATLDDAVRVAEVLERAYRSAEEDAS